MNRYLLTTMFLVLFSSCLYGEELKVSVKTDGDKLEFSYVYVNGTIVCVADSLGVAYVPIEKINVGDTVSASFLGYIGDGVVYDLVAADTKELNITMFPIFTADEVVVKADILELYRKFVNKRQYLNAVGQQFDFNFATDRVNDDNISVKKSSGEVSFQKNHMLNLYKFPKFKLEGDTTNLREDLSHSFNLMTGGGQLVKVRHLTKQMKFSRERGVFNNIAYKGIIDESRLFIWTLQGGNWSSQVMFYVDKESGFLRYYEMNSTITMPNGDISLLSCKVNYKNEKNYLHIIDGAIRFESSNRGSYGVSIWDVSSKRAKNLKFKEGKNAFKPKYPMFSTFWE